MRDDQVRLAFLAVAGAALLALPISSLDYGITTDEIIQNPYGKLIVEYFLTLGADKSALHFGNTYLYGGLFDTVAATIHRIAPILDEYTTRHIVNALTGWVAILYTGLLAQRAAGWRAGLLALLLMLLSPRFIGHAMNNPKDIPFAAAYVFTLYYIVRFQAEAPHPSRNGLILLGVGIAAAIGVRIGGGLLIFYLLLAAGIIALRARRLGEDVGAAYDCAKRAIAVAILGYCGGLAVWPYAHANPILNPIKALAAASNFAHETNILFGGVLISSLEVPWSYLPTWIAISVPLPVLLGVLFGGLLVIASGLRPALRAPRDARSALGMISFAIGFPIAFIILRESTLYNGWRHALFIYPPLVCVAAVAWTALFDLPKRTLVRIAVVAVFAALSLQPFLWMLRNHPYESVYFNPLIGGNRGAFGRYEFDYWGNSLKGAAEWLAQNEDLPKEKVVVASIGSWENLAVLHAMRKYTPGRYVRFTRQSGQWDFAVVVARHWSAEALRTGWPPENTIHQIEVDGVPLAVVVKAK